MVGFNTKNSLLANSCRIRTVRHPWFFFSLFWPFLLGFQSWLMAKSREFLGRGWSKPRKSTLKMSICQAGSVLGSSIICAPMLSTPFCSTGVNARLPEKFHFGSEILVGSDRVLCRPTLPISAKEARKVARHGRMVALAMIRVRQPKITARQPHRFLRTFFLKAMKMPQKM